MSGEGDPSALSFKCSKSELISFAGPRQPDDDFKVLRNAYNLDSS